MFSADTNVPLGGMLTPVLASLLRCLRVSENRGVYHGETSRPGHSWQARKKISSVAFLQACTKGNSHPSTTGTPQLKAAVNHTGNTPVPPTFPPSLFPFQFLHLIWPSSWSLRGLVLVPSSLPPPPTKILSEFQSRKVTGATHGVIIIKQRHVSTLTSI